MPWFHVHIERTAAWSCFWLGFFRVYRWNCGRNAGRWQIRWNR